jgi:iron complex outermembrane receptor protein
VNSKTSIALRASCGVGAVALALLSVPSFAQDAAASAPAPAASTPATAAAPQPASTDTTYEEKTIVVTGSIIRNPNAASAAPITVMSSEDLSQRGITTIADAVQSLSANNGGTMPPSWSAFGFATGASAPSLRGLNDAYTLTLFDGLRSAVYPLADDGYRNFVDINSIPQSIVDKIDVLQEGASSTYGSDAIAGVVNVQVKKEIKGLHVDLSGGISQRGDAGETKASASYGYGDLAEQGFNFYVNAEYQHNDPLYLRQRGFPFNTADQSRNCDAAGACMNNSIINGIQADGSYGGFGATPVGFVRPFVNGAGVGRYQLLDPAAGCRGLPSVTLNAAQLAAVKNAPPTVCQYDNVANNYQYDSDIKRWGANAHLTVNIGSNAQAYAMFNYYEVQTSQNLYYQLNFSGGQIQTPNGTNFMPSPILLPVYVCPQGIGNADPTMTGCNAANGRLNPNNPFASAGEVAALSERFNQPSLTLTDSRTYRFSGGINGSFGDNWSYNVQATTSWVDLDVSNLNYLQGQDVLNAIATGSYNFVDPSANSAAAIAAIAPPNVTKSSSRLTEIQATLQKDLFKLPGGPLTMAIGGAYRFEALNNPSSNPGNPANIYDGYVTINPVGAIGSRRVYSGFYEIDAPIIDMLTVQAQGRYDSYSSGQDNFSPKFALEFKPIKQVKFRATYSQGFRVPSFNQAFGLPTTGYVTTTVDCTNPVIQANFCSQHSPNYYANMSGGTYQYGLTSTGNSSLSPEKSDSYTLGLVVQPTHNIVLTLDYFHTKISNIIIPATPDQSLITEYYENNGVVANAPPGVKYIPGAPDPNNPGALPILGFISASYTNADKEVVSGLDFSATARVPIGTGRMTWISKFSASYLIDLAQTLANGTVEEFDGSLSPCNITSCSGSPAWRANWANTLNVGDKYSFTLTAYYTSGYDLASTDYGGIPGNCTASIGASVVTYSDGTPVKCRANASFDMDLTGQVKIDDHLTVYMNIINLLDSSPVYDPSAAYSLYQFNPAWDDKQFIGRFFRIGAKVDF